VVCPHKFNGNRESTFRAGTQNAAWKAARALLVIRLVLGASDSRDIRLDITGSA